MGNRLTGLFLLLQNMSEFVVWGRKDMTVLFVIIMLYFTRSVIQFPKDT